MVSPLSMQETQLLTACVDSSKFECPVAALCACASATFRRSVLQSLHNREIAILQLALSYLVELMRDQLTTHSVSFAMQLPFNPHTSQSLMSMALTITLTVATVPKNTIEKNNKIYVNFRVWVIQHKQQQSDAADSTAAKRVGSLHRYGADPAVFNSS